MLRFFARFFIMLLPLLLFAGAVLIVRDKLFAGERLYPLLILLGALALLAIVEGLIFRYWVLPAWGGKLADKIYAGSYDPKTDALAQLSTRIQKEKDAALLPEMEKLVHQQADRTRGWLELARIHQYCFDHPQKALDTLLEGAKRSSAREDRALLLYRAASLCEKTLSSPEKAQEIYNTAATQFPKTTYGKKAAQKLI